MIRERLIKGAGILGSLWREGIRCISAWSCICPCETQNSFCLAKKKWLGLVRELNGGKYPHDLSGNEGFLILECMDADMLEASRLKFLKTVPGARALMRIVRKEESPFQEALDLAPMETPGEHAEVSGPTIRVQEIGSREKSVSSEPAELSG